MPRGEKVKIIGMASLVFLPWRRGDYLELANKSASQLGPVDGQVSHVKAACEDESERAMILLNDETCQLRARSVNVGSPEACSGKIASHYPYSPRYGVSKQHNSALMNRFFYSLPPPEQGGMRMYPRPSCPSVCASKLVTCWLQRCQK